MFKNVASQKLTVFAFDATTGLPQTGDASNITAYVDKDYAGLNVLTDTSATEVDSTNAKGYYIFDLTQSETDANALLFTAKSSTANIVVIGVPALIYTVPPNFTLLSIDSNGRTDVIKINGASQTARDIGASVLLSSGTGTGQVSLTSGAVILTSAYDAAKTASQAGDVMKVSSGTGANQISLSSGAVILTAAYDAAKTAAQVSDIPTAVQNADALLKRDMSAVTGEAARSMLNAIRVLRNRVTASGGALTVYKEDGTTSAWTATLTTSSTADLIISQTP